MNRARVPKKILRIAGNNGNMSCDVFPSSSIDFIIDCEAGVNKKTYFRQFTNEFTTRDCLFKCFCVFLRRSWGEELAGWCSVKNNNGNVAEF